MMVVRIWVKLYFIKKLTIFLWIEFWLLLFVQRYIYFITIMIFFFRVAVYFFQTLKYTNEVINDKITVQPFDVTDAITLLGIDVFLHVEVRKVALKADENCLLRVLAGLPRKYLQCLVTLRSVYPLSPANNPYETLSSVTHAKHMHSIGHSSHISATIQTIANYIQMPHGPLGFICKCISNSNYIGFSICKVGTPPITRFFLDQGSEERFWWVILWY